MKPIVEKYLREAVEQNVRKDNTDFSDEQIEKIVDDTLKHETLYGTGALHKSWELAVEMAYNRFEREGQAKDNLIERCMEVQNDYWPEWKAWSAPRFFKRIRTELRTLDAIRHIAKKMQAQFTALKLRFAMLEDWQYRACDLLISWPVNDKEQRQVALDLYNEWVQDKAVSDD
jgi:hypothetical protein